jgi:uncharacterized protein
MLDFDIHRLLETRLLLQANSGGGKSYALRRIIEQSAYSTQQLIIDSEGEFATLREHFDFVVCAPSGADAVANPQTAAALARALWKSGVSAVLDIYELKARDRVLFVQRFVEALVNAPRTMWHPTLVIIDEIHVFAPQQGSAESLGAIIDLATRGRKRGLALLGATQRLSKLHKDVAAELLNKMIGRTGLDVDVARAADELGMTKKEATLQLRGLAPGEFFVFGPALSPVVFKTKIGKVLTTHPDTGRRDFEPSPPSKELLSKLDQLEGIQRSVEQEAATIESLTNEVQDLRKKLTQQSQPRQELVTKTVTRPDPKQVKALEQILKLAKEAISSEEPVVAAIPSTAVVKAAAPVVIAAPLPGGNAESKVLNSLSWWAHAGIAQPTRHQVAFVAGYTVSGHFNNTLGKLKASGHLIYPAGGALELTALGHGVSAKPASIPTKEAFVASVMGVLGSEPHRRVLSVLVENKTPMSREHLAESSGYTVSGHFNNVLGKLNSLGIFDYPSKGMVGLGSMFKPFEGK